MARQNRDIEHLAELCHILGDKTRLRILQVLQEGKSNVTCLCKGLKLPQPTVSRHLAIMRMAGLVANRREGKEIHYFLNDQKGNGSAAAALKQVANGASAVRIGPIIIGLAHS
jgi:DNA-binding transcriptional ArsR family regulator